MPPPPPQHEEALVREPPALLAARREQTRERDGARTLDVVVERGNDVAEGVEDGECSVLGEVLPLDDGARPSPVHRVDERGHEREVCVAAESLALDAEVERVLEQVLAIGADVEDGGHGTERADAAANRVECKLSDGMASPLYPWSPMPRIADESVATIIRASSQG